VAAIQARASKASQARGEQGPDRAGAVGRCELGGDPLQMGRPKRAAPGDGDRLASGASERSLFFLNFPIGSGQLNRLDLISSDGKQLTEIGSDHATAELLHRRAAV
jgi:hypothetical protein